MTLVIKSTRKVVVLGWNTMGDGPHVIKGSHASFSAVGSDGVEREVKNTDNDGEGNIFFPANYMDKVEVTVRGSKSGTDTATLNIS